MKGANPAAENWLRACVDAIAERGDRRRRPWVRSAHQIRQRHGTIAAGSADGVRVGDSGRPVDQAAAACRDDKRPELGTALRRHRQADRRRRSLGDDQADAKKALYSTALASARDLKQLEKIESALTDLGEEVDLAGVLGFLKQWQIIGPFDNTSLAHFDTAYPPEIAQDLEGEYEGKLGQVAWKAAKGDGKLGEVGFHRPAREREGSSRVRVRNVQSRRGG